MNPIIEKPELIKQLTNLIKEDDAENLQFVLRAIDVTTLKKEFVLDDCAGNSNNKLSIVEFAFFTGHYAACRIIVEFFPPGSHFF